jgi:hypothetical protein
MIKLEKKIEKKINWAKLVTTNNTQECFLADDFMNNKTTFVEKKQLK